MRVAVAALGVAVALSAPSLGGARADQVNYLVRAYRDVPMVDGASRETPAFELAYGPHPPLAVGGERGLVDFGLTRVGAAVLIGLDAIGDDGGLVPSDAWRQLVELAVQHRLARFADGGRLELIVGLGYASAGLTREVDTEGLVDTDDIPFGGGGLYLALELAGRLPLGRDGALDLRLRHRWFTNAWATLFDAEEAAATIASTLEEGLAHAPAVDAVLRWEITPNAEAIAALRATWLVPADRLASDGYRVRLLLGTRLNGAVGGALPFVALEAGNGHGVLVARRELRLTVGVRVDL